MLPSIDDKLSTSVKNGFMALSNLLGIEQQEIRVNRETAATELLHIYEDKEILQRQVHVEFKEEIGDDFGGLTKDLYTCAWRSILNDFFVGEDCLVPFLPLHRQRKEGNTFVAIGRLLTHSAALLGELPTRISRVMLMVLVFGPEGVDEELLLEDFRLFLPLEERHLVWKAMSKFEALTEGEQTTLLSTFSSHGLLEIPKQSEIRQQVLAMASHELVSKPAPFVSLMRKGIPEAHFDIFWSQLTNETITYIFSKQIPTPCKVLAVMTTENDQLTMEQDTTFHYLCQFIKTLDSDDLAAFLLFITGSTSMPDKIVVTFTHLTGICRRPIAHTCSNLLELPSGYSSFQDLKREFRKVLLSDYSFQMTMF